MSSGGVSPIGIASMRIEKLSLRRRARGTLPYAERRPISSVFELLACLVGYPPRVFPEDNAEFGFPAYVRCVGIYAFVRSLEEAYMATGTVKRSEEHTSELQSLMRTSYAVLCLK